MNSELPDDFAARLVARQQTNESLRQRYERLIDSTFERPMTASEKFNDLFSVIACIGFALFFTYLAVLRTDLPEFKRAIAALAIPASALFAILRLRRFRRGTINVQRDRRFKRWIYVAEIALAVVLAFRLSIAASDPLHTVIILLSLLMAGLIICLVQMRMLFAELGFKLEERILELQLRVAELGEQGKPRS